jgi:hypothetical protein
MYSALKLIMTGPSSAKCRFEAVICKRSFFNLKMQIFISFERFHRSTEKLSKIGGKKSAYERNHRLRPKRVELSVSRTHTDLVSSEPAFNAKSPKVRVARFFLLQTYQIGKNISNDHKLCQTAINYSKWP